MPINKDNNESLDNLFEAFSNELTPTKEEMMRELEARGIDASSVAKDGLAFVQKLQARTKIALAKKEMLKRVALAKDALRSLAPKLSINNKEQLAKMLFGEQANIAVNFNKLNELSDDDIISMLSEVQLLEFLEKLKSDKK